ncbi:hypothetical protein A8H36_05630 [Burkholderia thailandensis]|nr:hypothetical protein A8H36_05630 [Burkholderia thailandensis]
MLVGHRSTSIAARLTRPEKARRINGLSAAHPGSPQACQQKMWITTALAERDRRCAARAIRVVDAN